MSDDISVEDDVHINGSSIDSVDSVLKSIIDASRKEPLGDNGNNLYLSCRALCSRSRSSSSAAKTAGGGSQHIVGFAH